MKRVSISIDDIKGSACAHLNPHLFAAAGGKKKKRSKFNNEKVEYDGNLFDSQHECNRYITLRYKEGMQEIKNLRCQVSFRLESEDKKICDYVADFTYTVVATGKFVVEDAKSPATRRLAPYRMKKKLMAAQHKIEIKEV